MSAYVVNKSRWQALGQPSGFKWKEPLNARKEWGVGRGTPATYDNLAAFTRMATSLASAGPGSKAELPPGVLLTSGPVALGANAGMGLVGQGRMATIIRKTFDGPLVTCYGTGTINTVGTVRNQFCSLEDLTLDGNSSTHTGALLDAVYADNLTVRRVKGQNNNGKFFDCAEFWDSLFDDVQVDSCSGINFHIRSSRAASGFGASADTSNVIRFRNLRCESWTNGVVVLELGTSAGGTGDPNHLWFDDFKMESKFLDAAAFVVNSGDSVILETFYIDMANFVAGHVNGVQPAIAVVGGQDIVIRDGTVGNEGVATMEEGIYAFVGGVTTIDNVKGIYFTAPTSGFHVNLDGGGPYDVGWNPVLTNNAQPVRTNSGVTIRRPPYAGAARNSIQTITNVETVAVNHKLNANHVQVGTEYRVEARGTIQATSAGTLTAKLRVGTAGTTADASLASVGPTGAATAAIGFRVWGTLLVTGIGASGAIVGNLEVALSGASPVMSAVNATIALDTTSDKWLSVTLVGAGTSPSIKVTSASIVPTRVGT